MLTGTSRNEKCGTSAPTLFAGSAAEQSEATTISSPTTSSPADSEAEPETIDEAISSPAIVGATGKKDRDVTLFCQCGHSQASHRTDGSGGCRMTNPDRSLCGCEKFD